MMNHCNLGCIFHFFYLFEVWDESTFHAHVKQSFSNHEEQEILYNSILRSMFD
uniref:Uncharacterized protein n=1 Tax=Anguilla anguilla TaxID=7936 RepID=A0A0E9QV47_ANGAN